MKAFFYICQGGPLDGIKQGPFPPAVAPAINGAGGLDDDTREKWLAEPFTICTAYARRGKRLVGPARGRYDIRQEEDGFVANHVPSEDDVYFSPIVPAGPPVAGLPSGLTPPPKGVSTLDLR